jgi:hypothetical protein
MHANCREFFRDPTGSKHIEDRAKELDTHPIKFIEAEGAGWTDVIPGFGRDWLFRKYTYKSFCIEKYGPGPQAGGTVSPDAGVPHLGDGTQQTFNTIILAPGFLNSPDCAQDQILIHEFMHIIITRAT